MGILSYTQCKVKFVRAFIFILPIVPFDFRRDSGLR